MHPAASARCVSAQGLDWNELLRVNALGKRIQFVGLSNPSDSKDVAGAVRKALDGGEADEVSGVHYSGGTKTMSTYAVVQAMHAPEAGHDRPEVSHLDARRYELVFDDRAAPLEYSPSRVPVYGAPVVTLLDLVRAHGLERLPGWYKPEALSSVQEVGQSFLASYLSCARAKASPEWRRYLSDNASLQGDIEECLCTGRGVAENHSITRRNIPVTNIHLKNLNNGRVTTQADKSASEELAKVQSKLNKVLREQWGEQGSSPFDEQGRVLVFRAAQLLGFHREGRPEAVLPCDFVKWLHGAWLETVVADVLSKRARNLGLDEIVVSYESRPDQGKADRFELDVVMTHGYQLLAVSCTTKRKKSDCKLKLFEAVHRARQLGGDEASVALVCGYHDARELRAEMYHAFDHGPRIEVFGLGDLNDLGRCLPDWVQRATKPIR